MSDLENIEVTSSVVPRHEFVVCDLTSRIIMHWETEQEVIDLHTVALSCLMICARRLYMPQLFIQILPWTMATRGNVSLYHSQCIQTAPVFKDDAMFFEAIKRFHCPSDFCIVCYDSRQMWPEDGMWFSGYENGCRRCCPCDVCSRCRVIITRSAHDEDARVGFAQRGVFVCLDCVEGDEVHQLNRNQKRRWTALKDWKATEDRQ